MTSASLTLPVRSSRSLLILLAATLACTGETTATHTGVEPDWADPSETGSGTTTTPQMPDKTPGDQTGITACMGSTSPGRTPLRHLTNVEYDNTIFDLLGDNSRPSTNFPADTGGFGYANNADTYSISTVHVEKYLQAAEALSASADLTKLLPCSPTSGTASCADDFIETFGRRAYRRPLTADDKTTLKNVFLAGKQVDFATGIRLVIQAVLQSADFLYRPEFGAPGEPGDIVPLTDHEMAARLSYFLWQGPPDAILSEAADKGELRTAEQVEAQARRMIADPKAVATATAFHMQWLELGALDTIEKDATMFPKFETLRPLMKKETELFFKNLFADPNANASTLFTTTSSWMNKPLATFYGLTGPAGSAFEKVELDPTRRVGFLTQAALMAVNATSEESHPVIRGKFVRERLLCQHLTAPPENVVIAAPDPSPDLTTRERYAEHSSNATCAGCHVLMDPIGFSFENYDAIGAYRTTENNLPIDASGELTHTTDVGGPFSGAVELTTMLADSNQVKDCMTTQWFRFANNREESDADECSIAFVRKKFADSGHKIPELMVALTQTDSFLFRKVTAPGAAE